MEEEARGGGWLDGLVWGDGEGLGAEGEGEGASEAREGARRGREEETYHGQGLNAQHKGVGREIARVGEGVFLPQLGEERLGRGNGGVVEDKVALEEEVEEAAWVLVSKIYSKTERRVLKKGLSEKGKTHTTRTKQWLTGLPSSMPDYTTLPK